MATCRCDRVNAGEAFGPEEAEHAKHTSGHIIAASKVAQEMLLLSI